MLDNLKKKWNVSGWQLLFILCVFAITGTTTAFLARVVTGWMGLTADSPIAIRMLIRLAVLVFGYQAIILIVSIPFGQFRFFWNYEKKILRWFGKRFGVLDRGAAVVRRES